MPKVTGPLFSLDAKGTLAGAITYQGTPKGPRVGRVPRHKDALSDAQLAHRELFLEARDAWLALSPEEKAQWTATGQLSQMTGWNAFLKDYILNPPPPEPQVYEYYNTGDDASGYIHGATWYAQSFTPQATHTLTKIRLKLYKLAGCAQDVNVQIYLAGGDHKPTGGILSIGTISIAELGTVSPGDFEDCIMAEAGLTIDTEYVQVVYCLDDDNGVFWRYDGTDPTYTRGLYMWSSNSGSTWTVNSARDLMFEEWGI